MSTETFDDFLAGQGILEECEELAIKRVLAWQIAEAMKAQGITKTAMASRMKTDRRQLDPQNPSVILGTLRRWGAGGGWNWPERADNCSIEPVHASLF